MSRLKALLVIGAMLVLLFSSVRTMSIAETLGGGHDNSCCNALI
jgi:hypothetical protein